MPAVKIELQVGGVQDVRSSFRTVTEEAIRAQTRINKERQRASNDTVKTTKDEATKVNAIQRAQANDAAREAKRVAKEKERAAREETRTVERNAKEQQRQRDAIERDRERQMKELTRDVEREEKAQTRIVEREAKARAAAAKNEMRAREEASRALRHEVAGRVTGSVRGIVSGAGALAAGAMSFAGGLTATDAINRRMSEQDAATAVANAAFMPEVEDANGKIIQEKRDRPDAAVVASHAREVGMKYGMDSGDLLAGLQSYVEKSSDYEGGMKNLGDLANLAKGTHSSFGDVMNAAGMLRSQNPNLDPEGMMSIMRNAIGQGQFGSISLADIAQHAATVTAGASVFGGDQAKNQGKLLGLMQVAGRASDPAEAATAVARFGDDVSTKMKAGADGSYLRSGNMSAKVADKSGKLLDPAEILRNIFAASGGQMNKIHALGLGERSEKIAKALSGTYDAAEAVKKGSGADAVYKDVSKLENAGYAQGDVDDSTTKVMQTDSEKLHAAMQKLEAGMATALMPAVTKMIEKLPEFLPAAQKTIDAFVELAGFILANPIQSAFAGLGVLVAKEVVTAGIGTAMKQAVEKSTAMSFAQGIAIATAAITITKAAIEEIDKAFDEKDKRSGNIAASAATDDQLAKRIASGKGSAKDTQDALAEVDRLKAQQAVLEKGPGFAETAVGAATQLLGGKAGDQAVKDEEMNRQREMLQLGEQIRALTAAVEKNTTAQKNTPAGGPAPKGGGHDPKREGPMGTGGSR